MVAKATKRCAVPGCKARVVLGGESACSLCRALASRGHAMPLPGPGKSAQGPQEPPTPDAEEASRALYFKKPHVIAAEASVSEAQRDSWRALVADYRDASILVLGRALVDARVCALLVGAGWVKKGGVS